MPFSLVFSFLFECVCADGFFPFYFHPLFFLLGSNLHVQFDLPVGVLPADYYLVL